LQKGTEMYNPSGICMIIPLQSCADCNFALQAEFK
jgi:hypothetical protein